MRVWELAQELSTTPAQVLDALGSLGVEDLTHLSVVNDEVVEGVKDAFQKRSSQVSGGEVRSIFGSSLPEGQPEEDLEKLDQSEIPEPAQSAAPTDGQVAILACHKSGKSAYLYVLGALEGKGKIGRWTMSPLSEQFAKFFNQKKSQRNNWPPTDWRILEDFPLFGVRNETAPEAVATELELRAFDTGGENFEIAFDPHRRESVSPDQEKSVERIKRKVLDANGYIILIDGELTDPEYAQRMEDLDGWVSPEDFLRNFYNTLANEGGGALLRKPIAFVLTKGDLFYNEEFWSDEKSLPRFAGAMERAVTFNLPEDYEAFRTKSVDEGREEAEQFLKTRFRDAHIFSEKFPRRQYFVVSCWGFEPEYFAGDPPGGEPIPRRTMWKMSGERQHTYTRVRNIQPVCVEEPLEWILDEVAQDRRQRLLDEEQARRTLKEREEQVEAARRRWRRFKRWISGLIVSALVMYWGGLYWVSYGVGEFSLSQTGRDVVEMFGLSRRDATSFCNRACEFLYESASRYCAYRPLCDLCGVNLDQDAFGPVLLKVCKYYTDTGEFEKARSVLRKARRAGLPKDRAIEEGRKIDKAEKEHRTAQLREQCRRHRARGEFDKALACLWEARELGLSKTIADEEERRIEEARNQHRIEQVLKQCKAYATAGEFAKARWAIAEARKLGVSLEVADEEEKRIDDAERQGREAGEKPDTGSSPGPTPPKPPEPARRGPAKPPEVIIRLPDAPATQNR